MVLPVTIYLCALLKTGMKTAVVLMNLGSPDSTGIKYIRRYLDEFLMDERVIDKPWLLRALLVKGIIVPFRAPNTAKAYSAIWTDEGSPLMVISKQLQSALDSAIMPGVELAMRYGNPSPKVAFDKLVAKYSDLEEVMLVPLYPHYAMSSYETAVVYAKDIHKENGYQFKLKFIKPFFDNQHYINALCESIRPYVEEDYDQILFSYHGIPERHILKSDVTKKHCLQSGDCCDQSSPAHEFCYRHQCRTTTRLVADKLNIPNGKRGFSFQSRLGRDPWLQPYTAARLEQLPAEDVKKILVVCPAFVSDCLETVEEMGQEGKEIFLKAGGEQFTLIPCLNVHPMWIAALSGWLNNYLSGNKEMLLKTMPD